MLEANIRLATSFDVLELAQLHSKSLPDDYLPSLGLNFLQEEYYPAALQSFHAATYAACVEGRVVGFVTVAHDSAAFTQDVVRNRSGAMVKYALAAMLRNPTHIFQSFQVFWAAIIAKPDPIPGEIVFIAVDENYRNYGIGKQLVQKALGYLRQHYVKQCRTKTLAQNKNVIGMYEKLGWAVHNRFRLIGKEYVTLVSNSCSSIKGQDER